MRMRLPYVMRRHGRVAPATSQSFGFGEAGAAAHRVQRQRRNGYARRMPRAILPPFVSLLLGLAAPAAAQQTWTVNASPGAGAQFQSLAAAVAAAADGDVIVCQHPTFGESLGGFTTSKGLTIVGDAAGVPLTTLSAPIQVVGLPAGRTFRMAGFQSVMDGELRISLQNCAGRVELDNLQARSPDFGFPTGPAIEVVQCASVHLREVVDFGSPALRIDSSRVVLSSCWLGMTRINVGGGAGLVATNAEVDVVQPRFRTGGLLSAPGVGWPAIAATNSVLRIAGGAGSLVSGGPPVSATGGPAIVANGGFVHVDPAVALAAGLGAPTTAGTATFVAGSVPATWAATSARAGQTLSLSTAAAAGAAVWLCVGLPSALASTPLGTLGVEPASAFVLPAAVATAGAPVATALPLPAALLRGQAFAAQAVVWDGAALRMGAPLAFVVQ
jgi:hypothetical protein